jgi:hypothetical protein
MTKTEHKIDLRTDEIWAEHYYSGEHISEWKARSQAVREWREQQQKSRKVKLF